MQALPMLRSKISATKKRLSESVLNESVLTTLSICLLFVVLAYVSKLISLDGNWGHILVDIPVVSQPFKDQGLHQYSESPSSSVSAQTLVVAVTPNELIFGDMKAFTTLKDDLRNKFVISHKEGSPQLGVLLTQHSEWSADRENRLGIRDDKVAIILPSPAVPVAVVAGIVDGMRQSGKFSHVVVGGGLL